MKQSDGRRFGDQQLLYFEQFNNNLRKELAELISDDLIAEHQSRPYGQHSEPLERVLNFLRRAPVYALYARVPCQEFCIIRLPVVPGSTPEAIDGRVFYEEHEAAHAAFLLNLNLLRDDAMTPEQSI